MIFHRGLPWAVGGVESSCHILWQHPGHPSLLTEICALARCRFLADRPPVGLVYFSISSAQPSPGRAGDLLKVFWLVLDFLRTFYFLLFGSLHYRFGSSALPNSIGAFGFGLQIDFFRVQYLTNLSSWYELPPNTCQKTEAQVRVVATGTPGLAIQWKCSNRPCLWTQPRCRQPGKQAYSSGTAPPPGHRLSGPAAGASFCRRSEEPGKMRNEQRRKMRKRFF